MNLLGGSSLADAPVGDVEEMADCRHQGGQVPLVDAALSESRREEFKQLNPLLDAVRLGRRRDFDPLLDDTDRAFQWVRDWPAKPCSGRPRRTAACTGGATTK
jgi:hypothetical protein